MKDLVPINDEYGIFAMAKYEALEKSGYSEDFRLSNFRQSF